MLILHSQALTDVLENRTSERKTSEALQTNLDDVGTMLKSVSSTCQQARSQVISDSARIMLCVACCEYSCLCLVVNFLLCVFAVNYVLCAFL